MVDIAMVEEFRGLSPASQIGTLACMQPGTAATVLQVIGKSHVGGMGYRSHVKSS